MLRRPLLPMAAHFSAAPRFASEGRTRHGPRALAHLTLLARQTQPAHQGALVGPTRQCASKSDLELRRERVPSLLPAGLAEHTHALRSHTKLRFTSRWTAADATRAVPANPALPTYPVITHPERICAPPEGHVTLTRPWIGFDGSHRPLRSIVK